MVNERALEPVARRLRARLGWVVLFGVMVAWQVVQVTWIHVALYRFDAPPFIRLVKLVEFTGGTSSDEPEKKGKKKGK